MLPEPPPIPAPVSVVNLGGFPPNYRVVFDTPLSVNPLAAANWTARETNTLYDVSAAVVEDGPASRVLLTREVAGAPNPGPDVLNYAAAPPDLVSDVGQPAAAFVDFPFT